MIPLRNITVGQLLTETCLRFPDRPAVIDRGTSYSYSQFHRLTEGFACALLRHGITKGDHVGIYSETALDTIALYFAVQRIGAISVMVSPALGLSDLYQVLLQADVKYLCVGANFSDPTQLAATVMQLKELPCLKGCFSFGNCICKNFTPLSPLYASSDRSLLIREEAVRPDDTAAIIFTSGSSGLPKAVMTSHYSRVNSGIQQAHDIGISCLDVFCVSLPMFHCFCISANIMAAVSCGACLCIPEDRHTRSILTAIQTYRCSVLHAVPSMLRAILARDDFKIWDLSSLRVGIVGGAYYPPADFIRFEKALGMTLISSLGQTEATAGLTVCEMDDSIAIRSTTVGHFMDHVQGKIVDPDSGCPLPPGGIGEICVKGYLVMQGFYEDPVLTAKQIDTDGWLHTGDLGSMDENGYLTLHGRLKELIIRAGENISPVEIQKEIMAIEGVRLCQVFGVPDPHYGEEICACVVLNPGVQCDESHIREKLSATIATYKIPKYILFMEKLPVNSTGKINLAAVSQLAMTTLGLSSVQ